MSRKYTHRTLKALWGLSGGHCAYPGCGVSCIQPATATDPFVITGVIAHIEASAMTDQDLTTNYQEKSAMIMKI
jgi:hypothetical protein